MANKSVREKSEPAVREKSEPSPLNLRFNVGQPAPDPDAKRFDFFLIDTGWHEAISKVVLTHLRPLAQLSSKDDVYLLSKEQSFEIIRKSPHLIGHDPIILVYDQYAPPDHKTTGYRGFRLNLGLIRHPNQALARLQEFLRFVALNRNAVHLQNEVRRELYREGLDGVVKILRETSTELL